ncbi:MAG: hypothetical protein ABH879_08635 [archaeon]
MNDLILLAATKGSRSLADTADYRISRQLSGAEAAQYLGQTFRDVLDLLTKPGSLKPEDEVLAEEIRRYISNEDAKTRVEIQVLDAAGKPIRCVEDPRSEYVRLTHPVRPYIHERSEGMGFGDQGKYDCLDMILGDQSTVM